jgi:bifunctional DNase/RNase
MPIIVLKDVNSDSVLPIWVGVFEANAIALEIEKIAPPRPMTHDLLKNAITGLGATVERVVVTELRNDTFLAAVWATRNGEPIMIDARPSDAIALAMRTDSPIYVEEEVLNSSRVATGSTGRITAEDLRRWLEGLSDDDLGRYRT